MMDVGYPLYLID